MKKLLLLFCFFFLIARLDAFGSVPLQFDDVNPLTLLTPSLTVKANFYFGDEDETAVPLADNEFYLLDKSVIAILKDSRF